MSLPPTRRSRLSWPLVLIWSCLMAASSFGQPDRGVSSHDPAFDPSGLKDYRACGLNALYLISRFHHVAKPWAEIAAALRPSPSGNSSVADLERAATACGLEPVSARVDLAHLAKAPFPAIVQLRPRPDRGDVSHYVVLMGLFQKGVVTVDPPRSATYHPYEEFRQEWTGVVIAFPETKESRRIFLESLADNSGWVPRLACGTLLLLCITALILRRSARDRAPASSASQADSSGGMQG